MPDQAPTRKSKTARRVGRPLRGGWREVKITHSSVIRVPPSQFKRRPLTAVERGFTGSR